MPPQESGMAAPTLTTHTGRIEVGHAAEQELQRWHPLQMVRVRDPLDHDEETAVHTNSVVVYDPANKLGYMLGIDEVIHTTGKELLWKATHNGETADNEPPPEDGGLGCRRFYLCMLHQDNRCRAFHQCNNIHVDRARISGLRKSYHDCCRTRPISRTWTVFPVPDPENPSHILRIRLGSVADTVGKEMGIQGKSVKLCPHHTNGEGCPLADECPDLHLVSEVLKTFWVPCCVTHQKDLFSAEDAEFIKRLSNSRISIRAHGKLITVLTEHIGITEGLKAHLKSYPSAETFEFSRGKLCKRHKSRECKHGAQCNNIHVCREHFDSYYLERPKQGAKNNPGCTSPRTVMLEREVDVVPVPRNAVVQLPRAVAAQPTLPMQVPMQSMQCQPCPAWVVPQAMPINTQGMYPTMQGMFPQQQGIFPQQAFQMMPMAVPAYNMMPQVALRYS